MSNIFLISILIVISLFFIVNMIDDAILDRNKMLNSLYQNECSKTDTLMKIIKEIQKELKFTQLKDCPAEELKQIPKELIMWIDVLFNGVEQCQQENEE